MSTSLNAGCNNDYNDKKDYGDISLRAIGLSRRDSRRVIFLESLLSFFIRKKDERTFRVYIC